MTRIYTCNVPIEADLVDAFCWLQKGFTDQFVYYDKQRACRYMGLGRCIALPSLRDVGIQSTARAARCVRLRLVRLLVRSPVGLAPASRRCSSRSIASTLPIPRRPTS